jgi:hypothetical protein
MLQDVTRLGTCLHLVAHPNTDEWIEREEDKELPKNTQRNKKRRALPGLARIKRAKETSQLLYLPLFCPIVRFLKVLLRQHQLHEVFTGIFF